MGNSNRAHVLVPNFCPQVHFCTGDSVAAFANLSIAWASEIGNTVRAAHRKAWLRKAQDNTNTVFIALSHINNFDRELLK